MRGRAEAATKKGKLINYLDSGFHPVPMICLTQVCSQGQLHRDIVEELLDYLRERRREEINFV